MNGNSTLVHQANFSGGGFAKLLPFFFFSLLLLLFCFWSGIFILFFWGVWVGGAVGGVVTVGIFF